MIVNSVYVLLMGRVVCGYAICETVGCSRIDIVTKSIFVPLTSNRCHATMSVSTVVDVNGAVAEKSYFTTDVRQKKNRKKVNNKLSRFGPRTNTFQFKTDVS